MISDEELAALSLSWARTWLADSFTPVEMLTTTQGWSECRQCGAAMILSVSRMNYNTARHYLSHHPEEA